MRAVYFVLSFLFFFVVMVCGQQAGSSTAEAHPPLTIQQCSSQGSCSTLSTKITLDANWRWLHNVGGYTNCYQGNQWASAYCSDPTQCATNCALEGVDSNGYQSTYGIIASSSQLRLNFVTGSNVGSRVYLLDTDTTYKSFNLLNQEFAFDVNVQNLPCGLNGALYFSEMPINGGIGGNNAAGAKFGTGYCDSQCPQDVKFINGAANVQDWVTTNSNSGKGRYGACCAELDIWEANSMSTAFTPHPCNISGLYSCDSQTTSECGNADGTRYDSVCDHDGCDFNSYRMGNQTFFGPNLIVNTNQPVTVVTQFYTSDNTATGTLTSIKRFYVQNGQVIPNSASTFSSLNSANSIDSTFCSAQKTLFGDTQDFQAKGGLAVMGEAMQRGMVLVMSLWDDYAANCLWLDSNYPTSGDPSTPGVARGSCATTSGVPSDLEANSPNSYVVFSNIKYGPIGSTTSGVSGTTSSVATSSSGSTSSTSNSGSSTSNSGSTTSNSGSSTSNSGSSTSNSGSSTSNSGSTTSNSGSSSGTSSNSGSTTSSSGSSTTDSCPVGAEKCACTQGGTCDAGLTCLSQVCVDAGDKALSSSASTLSFFSLALFAAALYLF